MRKVVIYPGRFHPFHKGHKATYDFLVKKYGAANVFVTSTNTQAPTTSPFSFKDKKEMAKALGIPDSQFVQVKNPYQSREVTEKFDADKTAVIFALSEKDVERISFKPKKDGSPSYLQPVDGKMEPMSKHGYVDIAPTVDFEIHGTAINSASQLRQMYIAADDTEREHIIIDLYGTVKPKIKKIFDTELQLAEALSRLHNGMLKESWDMRYLEIINEVAAKERAALQEHEQFPEYLEETYHGDEFYEAYGDVEETLEEAEYRGRKVKLNKPMRGDVKKFKVYVKDPKTGNVKKVNFGDPNMRIKKSNPARRKSFRARHNCDNPGPKTKARYWSCRKW
jgi:hypothetical protein